MDGRIQGVVIIEATIARTDASRGMRAALASVAHKRQWAVNSGSSRRRCEWRAVPVIMTVTVNFTLQ
jgi:hypothetical protein